MEKINISELLKGCPSDMELDCTLYEDVYFDWVDELNIIHCYIQHETHKTSITFNQHGTPNSDIKSKCVIFPKGKTSWEGFVPLCQFKDGDIVAFDSKFGTQIFLFKEYMYDHNYAQCYMMLNGNGDIDFESRGYFVKRFATKEEKEKLFQAIKDNGYKWNEETNTLEELVEPKFKVGDTITNGKTSITIGYIDNEYYYEISRNIANRLFIKNQDEWNLVSNKFDLTTLKPFKSEVLVRDSNKKWRPAIYGFCDKFATKCAFYVVGGCVFEQCIPYEGNEHLLGKTDDCDEYFKNWE